MGARLKVKELINLLNTIEDKEQEVYVWEFSDIGGWSDSTTDIGLDLSDGEVYLVDKADAREA